MNASIKATAKRYRYTGKERDEESGLYYHGARYYIPWLCRWSASDPLEREYAGMSAYNYGNCNSIVFNDPSGIGGELLLKDNVVTVNATFIFYGSPTTSSSPELREARQKAISARIKKIQSSLNESGLKMEGPEGVINNENEISFYFYLCMPFGEAENANKLCVVNDENRAAYEKIITAKVKTNSGNVIEVVSYRKKYFIKIELYKIRT